MECSKCHELIDQDKKYNKCDLCHKTYCYECSPISSTEERCMKLTTRILKYFCTECDRKKTWKLNAQLHAQNELLQKQISKTQAENRLLHEQNSKLLKNISTPDSDNLNSKEVKEIREIIREEISTELMANLKAEILHEVAQIRQEMKNLTESNLDLIKLYENLPLRQREVQLPQFSEIVKQQSGLRRNNPITPNEQHNQPNKLVLQSTTLNKIDEQQEINTQENQVEKEFQIVTRRRKKNIKYGTSETRADCEIGFEGRDTKEKKIWLFISRVKNDVTEGKVSNYITHKTNEKTEEISVKKVNTYFKTKDNNCFLIGVNPKLRDLVYKEDFWPKKVAYARFDFKKGQHFLDNPRNVRREGREENLLRDNHIENHDADVQFLVLHKNPQP